MKVSIITSCFNRERTIRKTIESVLAQDYGDIEYIIVDGSSTDGTLSIIREYEDKIFRIVSEPDKGMYEGINKGIRLSTGDIVGLLHSDDIFFSNHTISDIVAHFEKTKADLVYGNGLFVNSADKVIRNWISGAYNKKRVTKGWLPLHPTVYIRRSVFEEYGYYDEQYKISADSDFLIRYLYHADLRVSYLNKYIVRMDMGGASTSWNKIIQKGKEDIHLYRKNGFNPYWVWPLKMMSKIPQFITNKAK